MRKGLCPSLARDEIDKFICAPGKDYRHAVHRGYFFSSLRAWDGTYPSEPSIRSYLHQSVDIVVLKVDEHQTRPKVYSLKT